MKTIVKLVLLTLLTVSISCASLGLKKVNLESDLKDAKLIVAVAEHLVVTGRLSDSILPDIAKVKQAIALAESYVAKGDEQLAIKSWQDAVILLMEVDRAVLEVQKKETTK